MEEKKKFTFKGLSLNALCDIYGVPRNNDIKPSQSAAILAYRLANDIRESVLRYDDVSSCMVDALQVCVTVLSTPNDEQK